MARILAANERLVQRATMGVRGEDGVIANVPLYEIVTVDGSEAKQGLTDGEKENCLDFARDIAPKFRQYAEAVRKREQEKGAAI